MQKHSFYLPISMLLQQPKISILFKSHLFNIYSELFGYNSPKKIYAKEVPLFHLAGVIHLIISTLDMVELGWNWGGTSCNSTPNSTLIPPHINH